MPKFLIHVDYAGSYTVEIEAEEAWQAEEKAEDQVQRRDDFVTVMDMTIEQLPGD